MKTLNSLISEVFHISEEKIHDELTPDDVESWDSMNALILVAAIETEYHIKMTSADVVSVACIGDIKKVLQRHGVRAVKD